MIAPFIYYVHRQIEELHEKQVNQYRAELFVACHGQGLLIGDFEKLQQKKYVLLSFNSFLSARKN